MSPYCSRVHEIHLCSDERDEEVSLAIYNEIWPLDAITMDELRWFKSQTVAYGDFLGSGGSAAVALMNRRPDVGTVILTVLPGERGRGLGTALYRTVSTWLSAREIAEIEAPVREDDEDSLAFAVGRGFHEVERERRMTLDLAALEPQPVDAPEGIEISTWAAHPDLIRGIYDVAIEAEPDVPGNENDRTRTFEDWLAEDMQGPGDRADAMFVALAGAEVVGYAKFSLTAAQPETAHHDMTGVKRAWRGRGIAGALKRAQISWAKAQGYQRLVTRNEVRNEPIRRLNKHLGYREAPGRIIVRGPLATDA
jgi:mycothiol synthase